MRVLGRNYRTIWLDEDGWSVGIIDQTRLPHSFETVRLAALDEMAGAIRGMRVRGAPLIGVAAAYGMALALHRDSSDAALDAALRTLAQTRPTAVNLRWALGRVEREVRGLPQDARAKAAYALAARLADEDVDACRRLGEHGLSLLNQAWTTRRQKDRLNILTHCNAGWLATVDYGTALAPVYLAHERGMALHVWVDETRPRNQGLLTAWELGQQGIPHTVVADNAGGHLMQRGLVDLCLVGTDRTAANGDVCNKVGTYLKALAAHDNGVPFYVAVPGSSIDFGIGDGLREIPIEQRDAREVHEVSGRLLRLRSGRTEVAAVRVTPEGSEAANYAFDVTPARLVTALITERGVCPATADGLTGLFPERAVGTT